MRGLNGLNAIAATSVESAGTAVPVPAGDDRNKGWLGEVRAYAIKTPSCTMGSVLFRVTLPAEMESQVIGEPVVLLSGCDQTSVATNQRTLYPWQPGWTGAPSGVPGRWTTSPVTPTGGWKATGVRVVTRDFPAGIVIPCNENSPAGNMQAPPMLPASTSASDLRLTWVLRNNADGSLGAVPPFKVTAKRWGTAGNYAFVYIANTTGQSWRYGPDNSLVMRTSGDNSTYYFPEAEVADLPLSFSLYPMTPTAGQTLVWPSHTFAAYPNYDIGGLQYWTGSAWASLDADLIEVECIDKYGWCRELTDWSVYKNQGYMTGMLPTLRTPEQVTLQSYLNSCGGTICGSGAGDGVNGVLSVCRPCPATQSETYATSAFSPYASGNAIDANRMVQGSSTFTNTQSWTSPDNKTVTVQVSASMTKAIGSDQGTFACTVNRTVPLDGPTGANSYNLRYPVVVEQYADSANAMKWRLDVAGRFYKGNNGVDYWNNHGIEFALELRKA